MALKRAEPGDSLRSGRLVEEKQCDLDIRWNKQWTFQLSDSCPKKIVLRRGWFGWRKKDLSAYVDYMWNGWGYDYLGGYVYHELTKASGDVTVYRDGESLVPDLLSVDSNSKIKIEGVPVGLNTRTLVDRYGNVYESQKIHTYGLGWGISSGLNKAESAIYYGIECISPYCIAKESRTIPSPTDIRNYLVGYHQEKLSVGQNKTTKGLGGGLSYQAGPWGAWVNIGNNTYTKVTKNWLSLKISFGSVGERTTKLTGVGTYEGWDEIDADAIGVSWEKAVNAYTVGP